MRDAGRYEILYDLPRGEYAKAEVGGIRTRTIRAGDTLEIECYPIARITPAAERERRRRASSPAQERLNLANARKKVRRLLEANFAPGDFAVHPTWDYGVIDYMAGNRADLLAAMERSGLPMGEEDARRALGNYLRRVKTRCRRNGGDPREVKYLYVLEATREPRDEDPRPLPARYHAHMAIHAPNVGREELEELWGEGYCNADRLDFHDNGLAAFAAYITKQRGLERRARGGHAFRRYAYSKNLKKPEERVSDRRLSRRRAALVARDVQAFGREVFEAIYPGYRCAEEPVVKYSDFVAGAYIFARMRRRR